MRRSAGIHFLAVQWHVCKGESKELNIMKIKLIACSALGAALLSGCCTQNGGAKPKDAMPAKATTGAAITQETPGTTTGSRPHMQEDDDDD